MTTRRNPDGTVRRGTSNSNDRGNTKARAARRAWLLQTYASNVPLTRLEWADGEVDYRDDYLSLGWWKSQIGKQVPKLVTLVSAEHVPTARCYRCGKLLHDGTVTADRIIPGCQGGTYVRSNIRPACGHCQSTFGGSQRSTG